MPKKASPTSRARQLTDEINRLLETELDEVTEEEYSNDEDEDTESAQSRESEEAEEEDEDEDEDAPVGEFCQECWPVVPDTFAGRSLSAKGRCCQICLFEGRGVNQMNVVTCKAHRVRVCADVILKPSPMVEWLIRRYKLKPEQLKWFCPNKDLTCWEKLHQYYIPLGLFPTLVSIKGVNMDAKKNEFFLAIKGSDLYRARENCVAVYEKHTGLSFAEDSKKRQAAALTFIEPPTKKQKQTLSNSQKKIAVLQQKEQLKIRQVGKVRSKKKKSSLDEVEIMSTVARGKTTRSPKSTMQENLQKRKDHNSDVAEKYDKLEALVLQLNEKISSMATQSLVASVSVADKEGAKAATVASQSVVASVPVAEKGSAEAATAVVISQPESDVIGLELAKFWFLKSQDDKECKPPVETTKYSELLSSRYSFIERKEISEMQSAAAKKFTLTDVMVDVVYSTLLFSQPYVFPVTVETTSEIIKHGFDGVLVSNKISDEDTINEVDFLVEEANNPKYSFIFPLEISDSPNRWAVLSRRWFNDKITFLYADIAHPKQPTMDMSDVVNDIPRSLIYAFSGTPLWPVGEHAYFMNVSQENRSETWSGCTSIIHGLLLSVSSNPIHAMTCLSSVTEEVLATGKKKKFVRNKNTLSKLSRDVVVDVLKTRKWKTSDWLTNVLQEADVEEKQVPWVDSRLMAFPQMTTIDQIFIFTEKVKYICSWGIIVLQHDVTKLLLEGSVEEAFEAAGDDEDLKAGLTTFVEKESDPQTRFIMLHEYEGYDVVVARQVLTSSNIGFIAIDMFEPDDEEEKDMMKTRDGELRDLFFHSTFNSHGDDRVTEPSRPTSSLWIGCGYNGTTYNKKTDVWVDHSIKKAFYLCFGARIAPTQLLQAALDTLEARRVESGFKELVQDFVEDVYGLDATSVKNYTLPEWFLDIVQGSEEKKSDVEM